jgi:hypothetical protein
MRVVVVVVDLSDGHLLLGVGVEASLGLEFSFSLGAAAVVVTEVTGSSTGDTIPDLGW